MFALLTEIKCPYSLYLISFHIGNVQSSKPARTADKLYTIGFGGYISGWGTTEEFEQSPKLKAACVNIKPCPKDHPNIPDGGDLFCAGKAGIH